MRTAAITLAIVGTVTAAAVHGTENEDRDITVMTRNVYHGVDAEIFDVTRATSFADLLNKVAAVYQGYQLRNFPERDAALAAEIDATRPDLIGLQEAVLVRTDFPADGPATPAATVALDYLQLLLDALSARGLEYQVVAQSIGFDAELPSALGFDVRHTDREVILARADLPAADLKWSNPQTGSFAVNCTIPSTITGPGEIKRGWASVDPKVLGKSFRFITTHLDGDCLPFTSEIQRAQAAEVLTGPAATQLPVIYVGDHNSPADGTGVAYNSTIAAGFRDAWTDAGVGAGLTCCQADDLLNLVSQLTSRIDVVLFRGAFVVRDAQVVGDDPTKRTLSGLWPSDHAGVVARLLVPKE
jgi:endonuclease/exonuclease/phosphatase family protein